MVHKMCVRNRRIFLRNTFNMIKGKYAKMQIFSREAACLTLYVLQGPLKKIM